MVIPVPQLVRCGKSLPSPNRSPVDSNYGPLIHANDTSLAAVERSKLNDCPRVIGTCLDVDAARRIHAKVFE